MSLGGFLFGFDASVISGVISFIVPEFGLNDWQLGLVVGAPTLAGVIAALTAAPLADAVGRRKVLLTLAALYSVSAIASAMAPNFETLVVARFMGGLAFASLGIAPMYIGEIAPPDRRGFLVSVNQMNIMLGFSVAYFANYFVLQAGQSDAAWVQSLGIDHHAWRWMLGLEALPALVWLVLLGGVPESPRWLVIRQRLDEAKIVLARLRQPEDIEPEIRDIQGSISGDALKKRYRVSELLSPALRLPITIGVIMAVAQQVTGINAIYFYAPSIFEQSGVGTNAAFAQATLIGITNVVVTAIAMLLIDRLGRRPLLLIGLAGVVLSTALAGYGFHRASYEVTSDTVAVVSEAEHRLALEALEGRSYESDTAFKSAVRTAIGDDAWRIHQSGLIQASIRIDPRLVLVGILGFVASFALSLGPVMWVLFSEIFPNRIRGLALAATGFFNSMASFAVQFVFPWELNTLGAAPTFFIYSGLGLVAWALLFRLLPETRGRSLEDIEQQLCRPKHMTGTTP